MPHPEEQTCDDGLNDLVGCEITGIRPLPSDPNIRSIRIGRRTAARVRATDIDDLEIKVGDTWTEELARQVFVLHRNLACRRTALNILSFKARSTKALIDRLVQRGHDREIAREIVADLVADGWVDDEAYGEAVARELLARQPAGRRLLVHKLRQRGIEADLADQIARKMLEDVDVTEQAKALAERRFQKMGDLPSTTAARRLSSLLARRGFDSNVIASVLEHLNLLYGR